MEVSGPGALFENDQNLIRRCFAFSLRMQMPTEEWHKFIDPLGSSDDLLQLKEIHNLALNNPFVRLEVVLQLLPLPPAFLESLKDVPP